MSMRRLFIGGPWDGLVRDVEDVGGRAFRPHESLCVPGSSGEVIVYHPRDLRWTTPAGGVSITVMTTSISRDLARPVVAALVKIAGIDVVWQYDPDDPG